MRSNQTSNKYKRPVNKNNNELMQINTLTRANKDNLPRVKVDLINQLPVLTPIGVRRCQVPHHENLILNLEENNMHEAAEFLKHLLDVGESEIETNSLKAQTLLVNKLKSSLTAASIARNDNQILEEITIFYNTASFFRNLSSKWLWIADELLKKALEIAKSVPNDESIANIIKFVYAQFLYEDMKDHTKALMYCEDVEKASEGKRWSTWKLLKIKQDSLYRETSILMSAILIVLSREVLKECQLNQSVELSQRALTHAINSGCEKSIGRAFYKLGKSQIATKQLKEASKSLSKYLAIVKRYSDYEGICDAYRELAYVRQQLNDEYKTMIYLNQFKNVAIDIHLPHKISEAHYCIGKYLLHQNRPSDASSHLEQAFNHYSRLGMNEEMNKARFLHAIAKGEEIIEHYMKLILQCGENDANALKKLLDWKNDRIQFWNN